MSSDFPFDLAFSAAVVFGHVNDVEKPPFRFSDVLGLVHENAWHGAMKTELEGWRNYKLGHTLKRCRPVPVL